MAYTSSQFWINAVKAFTAKIAGNVVFAEDLNEATDEIEAIEQILGTGLRTRTVVSYTSATTTWTTLTSRLNNMDAGIRSTDVAVHPQYVVKDGAIVQPTGTGTVPLTVNGFTGSSQPVAKFVGADGSTVPLQVNNTTITARTPTLTGTTTVNAASSVGLITNSDLAYSGDVIQVFRNAVKNASVTATGAATFTSLTVSGTATITDFSSAQHNHTSAATGGQVFPTGSMMLWAGNGASLPAGGWLRCDGSAVSRSTYSALFAVIGTAYGAGDGSTTFNLPDITDRFPRGSFTTSGQGFQGGQDDITLTATQLPAHTHSMNHDHAAFTSGGASDTTVNMNMTTGKEGSNELPGSDLDLITDGGGTGAGGTPLSGTLAHTHSIDVPAFVGSTGSAGTGASFQIINRYTLVHYIIKT